MAYAKLLKSAIANTDYTQQQIAEKCTKMGIKMDKSQINRLVNGRAKPTSIEISKILAKICNIDERILILEDYFDNAPKEIVEAFSTMKYLIYLYSSVTLENRIPQSCLEELREEIEKQPLSSFVIELIEEGKINIETNTQGIKIKSKDGNFIMNSEIIGFPVIDDAMQPLLPKGSQVTIELKEKYCNNDILLVKINNDDNYIIRQVFNLGTDIVLMPLNRKYEQITKNKKDVTILGKVCNLITKIQ